MWMSPLYLTKPSFLNLFINKLTRPRVVPIISASISWDTFGTRAYRRNEALLQMDGNLTTKEQAKRVVWTIGFCGSDSF
jgi:hypothetical protein